ncbi:reverse transcriptase domain-containing protein [Tanacetum coccineum]
MYGADPIAPIPIEAMDFGLRHHMIQQFQNTCQFHGLPSDDANRHIDRFLEITQHMKQNGVSNDALRLSLFPYSLTHHAIAWYDRLQRNSIHSFDDMKLEQSLEIISSIKLTKLRNEITKFEQKSHESLFEAWERYKLSIDRCPNYNMLLVTQIDTFYNGLTLSHRNTNNAAALLTIKEEGKTSIKETTIIKALNFQAPNYQAQVGPSNELTNYMKSNEATLRAMQTQMTNMKTELRNEFKSTIDARTNKIENQNNQIMNILTNMQNQNPSGSGSLPSNTVANPRGDVKAITTRSGVAYDGPSIPPTPSPLPKEVERETEATKDKVQNTSLESTAHVQPPVVQDPIPEPEVAPKPKPKPSIPYPSRLNDQKLREKANNQMLKFLQIFQRLHFDISFADALLHMPKFASTFKSLLSNKEKLFELANTPLNENCSAVLLKKLPEKLGDPVDYDVDPRVPLILGRPFLRTEVLRFLDCLTSGNPTPSDSIIASSSSSFTPFEGGDFILEEIETFLRTPQENLPNLMTYYYDKDGDILYQ